MQVSIPLKLRSRSAWPNIHQSQEDWNDAELWVVDKDWQRLMAEFVKGSDDGMVDRLLTGFGTDGKNTVFVVKVRKAGDKPIIILPHAVAYRPWLKLENLYVPIDKDLSPPMRRDIARRELAPDPNLVYWAQPSGGDSFQLNSIPIGAFKPMHNRIEYVVMDDPEQLHGWREGNEFDLESWGVDDEKPKPQQKPVLAKHNEEEEPVTRIMVPAAKAAPKKMVEITKEKPSVVEQKLRELESQWFANKGPMDDPARLALWGQMAGLNKALGRNLDAVICWMNSLWEDGQ